MFNNDQYKYKIYDETASLIADLYFKEQINEPEMHFLLNILESVIIKKDSTGLINVLKEWINADKGMEINQIIKETLLTIDFNDTDSLTSKEELIKELLQN